MTVKEIKEMYAGQFEETEIYMVRNISFCDEINTEIHESIEYTGISECSLDYMEAKDHELISGDRYLDFYEIDEDFYDGETALLILLNEEIGEIPDIKVWEDVLKGQISDQLLGEVIYYFSKTAKNYRGYGHLLNSYYDSDRARGEEMEALKYINYEQKEKLLNLFEPSEVHIDTDTKSIYAFYEVGEYTFHKPIDKETDELKSLPHIELNSLYVSGDEPQNMLCKAFCEFVIENIDKIKRRTE